ncbi:hypothetical protein TGAM01_v207403 [Trichoderma gamsii]|uniref:Uncharacterized protein n=1 Tax=Trichoderma gamsii TaxID=398673 RepID=A0A2P4ZHI8_9HYPO|nr:hypothetical protein TGAM01_v207403 [Trichoderma gamsii]PON23756.1 hypothetical protein TGAM01_v207403 [Trichoderma gamsii]
MARVRVRPPSFRTIPTRLCLYKDYKFGVYCRRDRWVLLFYSKEVYENIYYQVIIEDIRSTLDKICIP